MHVLDILENSAKAGADAVQVVFATHGTRLHMTIDDNGPGFPDAVRDDPCDPFRTTRTERGVGLGLGLLRQSAEQADGSIALSASPSGGVRVAINYDMGHIDAKPLGNLADACITAMLAWPMLELKVFVGEGACPVFDTGALRDALGGLPPTHPRVQPELHRLADAGLAPLHAWSEAVMTSDNPIDPSFEPTGNRSSKP